MPTRKQRRRAQKERRHEYETVWIDPVSGDELEEPPENLVAPPERRDGAKPKAAQQRGGAGNKSIRVPPPPSWERAAKRSLILGAAIFALFYILGSKSGGRDIGTPLALAGLYTLLFIPFTYAIDRFAHNRWQRRAEQQGQKRQPSKKR
jgi:hypothetical protein